MEPKLKGQVDLIWGILISSAIELLLLLAYFRKEHIHVYQFMFAQRETKQFQGVMLRIIVIMMAVSIVVWR